MGNEMSEKQEQKSLICRGITNKPLYSIAKMLFFNYFRAFFQVQKACDLAIFVF